MKAITILPLCAVLLLGGCGDYIHDLESGELAKLYPSLKTVAVQRNAVGPEGSRPIAVADFRYSDANSVFVAKSGSPQNPGTQKKPKSTILDAMNSCTVAKRNVVVLDSGAYHQKLDAFDNRYFQGLYAARGQAPVYSLRELGFVPADENSVFVAKSGSDLDGNGTMDYPYQSINAAAAACDSSRQSVVVLDSGTYEEPGIEFTGNFRGLVAQLGFSPTYKPAVNNSMVDYSDIEEIISATEFQSGETRYISSTLLNNGNIVIAYQEHSDNDKGIFLIYDENGNNQVAATIFESGGTWDISICTLNNGNFVIAYSDSGDSDKGKFVIYDEDGNNIVPPTEFESGYTSYTSTCLLNNGNFAIAYQDHDDSNKGKFVIYNESGNNVIPITVFQSSVVLDISTCLLKNTNFVIAYSDGPGKFVIYDEYGKNVVSATEFESGSTYYISACTLKNGNFTIAYRDSDDYDDGKFVIYDEDGNNIVSPTEFEYYSTSLTNLTSLKNGDFLITYSESTQPNANKGKFVIYDEEGNVVVSAIEFESGNIGYRSTCLLENTNFLIAYSNQNKGKAEFIIWYPYSYSGIKVSTTATINGLYINANENGQLSRLIEGAAALDIKWSELKNCTNSAMEDSTSPAGYAIYSSNDISAGNIKVYNNRQGIYTTSNTSVIEDSLIYWNSGPGIHIKGAAANAGDIRIEHNTFFGNDTGLRLESNHGTNEIIKNCIFFDNDNYGIKADNDQYFEYCVIYDQNENTSYLDSLVKTQDPFFINRGNLDPDDIDLRLQLVRLGYPADSPGYLFADDEAPRRDAGAWDLWVGGYEILKNF